MLQPAVPRAAADDCGAGAGDGKPGVREIRRKVSNHGDKTGMGERRCVDRAVSVELPMGGGTEATIGHAGQPAVLFVDGAPTRGNVRALGIFQPRGLDAIT